MKILRDIILAAALIGAPATAVAQAHAGAAVVAADRAPLLIEAGTGRVVSLRASAANVFVADPKVAEVRPASATSLFVFGVSAGRTTVAALDNDGHTIAQYDVTVQPSAFGASQAQAMITRLVPGSRVQVQAQSKTLLLSGAVGSAADAAQAVAIAKGYASEGQTVESQITIASPIQVTLRVRIAQVQRSVLRALGINWQALGTIGKFAAAFQTNTAVAVGGALTNKLAGVWSDGKNAATTLIDALAQDNLARILAEPNLTVTSGQTASFLVGGQFPIPVAQQNNAITVDWKNFGVSLSFIPTVFSDGRINLHVAPEVSELSNQNTVQISAASTNSTLVVPSLVVRRAETTVELGSGQSFAIAGLLQDTISQEGNGVPFLGEIPVLGALFRASSFNRQETELVIVVTPFIVRPVDDPKALTLPTDGYRPPREIDRLLFMRQVGQGQPAVPVRIPGSAGFIVQ